MKDSIKVGICDDDTPALGAISGLVEKIFTDEGIPADIELYSGSREMFSAAADNGFDLLLLDIDMPDKDGIQLGRELRRKGNTADIIFVSNCENRVFESFQAEPMGFVRKSNFFSDMTKYARAYVKRAGKTRKTLAAEIGGVIYNIPLGDIVYIEGALAKQHIYTDKKPEYYVLRSSMKELKCALEPYGFLRVHSGFIVNSSHISVIKNSEIVLLDGRTVPLSRSKAQETREKFLKLMRSNGSVTF